MGTGKKQLKLFNKIYSLTKEYEWRLPLAFM
jgi:hypothetical protein